MATANHRKRRAITSKSRRRAPAPAPPVPPPPDPLADLPVPPVAEVTEDFFKVLADVATRIEAERTELLQLRNMARCLADVLKYSDDDNCDQHADVATVIARLLDDVNTNLALIKIQLPTNKEEATAIVDASDKEVEV